MAPPSPSERNDGKLPNCSEPVVKTRTFVATHCAAPVDENFCACSVFAPVNVVYRTTDAMTLPLSPGCKSARMVVAVPSLTVDGVVHAAAPSAVRRITFARLPSVQPATAAPSPARPAFGELTAPPPESVTPFVPQRSTPLGETACAMIFTPPISLRVTTTAFPATSMVRP